MCTANNYLISTQSAKYSSPQTTSLLVEWSRCWLMEWGSQQYGETTVYCKLVMEVTFLLLSSCQVRVLAE